MTPLRITVAGESLVDLRGYAPTAVHYSSFHQGNTVKSSIEAVYVDSSFLPASLPDMCLHG